MKKILIVLFLSGVYIFSNAQVKDIQLWAGPIVKYNINKKFRLDFEQQFRFNQNISKYDFTFSEFSVRYSVLNYLDLKAVYRHTFSPSGQTETAITENDKSRVCFDASTGTEIFNTGIKAGYRLRYQDSWENTTKTASHYLRNRFDLSYNLSKLVDPYADWESYFRLDGKNKWRQHRYTIGLSWRVTKKLDIDSYFRYQKEINVKRPETDFVLGLGVVYTFN
jgi:hypothetical protein